MSIQTLKTEVTMDSLKAGKPRWCVGCGDYMILNALKKLMVKMQIDPAKTVNVSGIGCSGRTPYYINTYGIHGQHGRSIPLATGIAIARDDLDIFVSSGDGDGLSIGGNHFVHGINKNFNCVYVLYDNEVYALTKDQTSPTTPKGLKTYTNPTGSLLQPINPIKFAIGLGCTYVASVPEWAPKLLESALESAYKHKGFSLVHVAQRCPKWTPTVWQYKTSDWITLLNTPEVPADTSKLPDATVVQHDASDFNAAFAQAEKAGSCFGLFYKNESKPVYDTILREHTKNTPQKSRDEVLDPFLVK